MTYNEGTDGGVVLDGMRYSNGYKNRRLITIPANTFTESIDYYLGIMEIGIGEEILITDINDNVIGSRVRNYCSTSDRTHVFFEATITNFAIDNVWYLYHE